MKLFRLHGTFIASYDKSSQWDENYIILDDQHSVLCTCTRLSITEAIRSQI